MLGGAVEICCHETLTSPFSWTDTHLISGEISIGRGKTVTLIVANLIPLAGQKSS